MPLGGLPSGSDGEESACNAGELGLVPGSGRSPWRKKWQPIPVLLLEKSYRQKSLAGYGPKGRKGLDMTEQLSTQAISSNGIDVAQWALFFLLVST